PAATPSPATTTGGADSTVDSVAQLQDPEGRGGWLGADAVAVAPAPRPPTEVPAPAGQPAPAIPERHVSTRREMPETHRLGEEDLRRDPGGPRGTVIGVLAVLALVAVAAAAVLMLNAEGPAAPPQAEPTTIPGTTTVIAAQASGAPTSVRIEDDAGTAVTLGWSDPTGGAVSFVVLGKRADETPLEPLSLPQGTTMATVDGLEPGENCCFTVSAVYSVTRVAAAPA